MSKYECKACKNRGKPWTGSDPVCGFSNGSFNTKNWMCATVANFNKHVRQPDKIHSSVKITMCESEDCYATVNLENVDFCEEEDWIRPICLIVMWYKDRGRTDQMWLMFENIPPRPPTERELLLITEYLDTSLESFS